MKLNRHHPGPGVEQCRGDTAISCSDVENQIARTDARLGDEPSGPAVREPVVAPAPPGSPGHDAP